jgi:small subunit ribosomal protein S16
MLKIRFNRTGKRNRAQFRIVLQEHTIAPGGRHVEILGSYDPHTKKTIIQGEKIKEWMGKGAQLSDSVYNLLVKEGILEGKKRAKKITKSEEQKAVETEAKKAPVEEAPKAEATVGEKPAVEASIEASTEASKTEKKEEPKSEEAK